MILPPYISVAGITERGQAEAIRNRIRASSGLEDSTDRRMVFGVCANRQTIDPNGTGFNMPHRFPRLEQLPGLFAQNDPNDPVEMWIHYTDTNTGGGPTETPLFDRVSFAVDACVSFKDADSHSTDVNEPWGIQLNVPWPDPRALAKIATEFSHMEIALTIGAVAMAEKAPGTPAFWNAIDDLAFKVNHIVIDASKEDGSSPMDASRLKDLVWELRDEYPLLGIGVSNHLCAERVYESAHLLCNIPRVSTVALGGIRIPTDAGGLLDIDRAFDYVAAVMRLTTQH